MTHLARIDRLSLGWVIGQLVGVAIGGAIALAMIVTGITLYRDEPTLLIALSTLFAIGPIAAWGLHMASNALLVLTRRIGRMRTLVDLDAPEIVIPRRMPPRVLPILGGLWFTLFFGGMALSKFKVETLGIESVIVAAVLFLIFVYVPVRNIWTMARWKASAFAPLVLDAEGLLDRSITDRPRIPWRDIAEIDLESGYITPAGSTKMWLEAEVPDRRWFRSLRARRPPVRFRLNYGLQPDDGYALSLVRAYWQRRITGGKADAQAIQVATVQRS